MNTPAFFARFKRAFGPALALTALLTAVLPPAATAAANDGNPFQPERNPPFSSVVVLGDSLSDTGRTAAAIPAVFAFLYPSPPYAPGRLSNGPLWIEQLAPRLRLTYDPLDNFAWAGANTGRINVYTGLPGIRDELDELLATVKHKLDKKALYVVFGGSNDFLRILTGAGDPLTLVAEGVTNLVSNLRILHGAGAEKIVVVDLPNIGLTPRAIAGGVSASATGLSVLFNTMLTQQLNALDFPTIRVSTFNLLNAMVASPAAFGLTNVTDQGRFNPDPAAASTYLFWDDIHPTTHVHGFVAGVVFTALENAGLLKQLLKHPD